MTTDIKELVESARQYAEAVDMDRGFESGLTDCLRNVSDALEAQVELRAERDRLKAALQPFSDAYERLVRTQESMGFGDNATFGLGIKVSAIKAARKALGGDAS